MNKTIAVAVLLAALAAPQTAFAADDDQYFDGLIGAFGGMTVFPDAAYAGSFGPQADLVLGERSWPLRPQLGGGLSFNVGPAPYDMHLFGEVGAALEFLGGAQFSVGSVFVPQDGALEWSTMYFGLKKAMLAAPLVDAGGNTGLQFEVGPYFRYHVAVRDETPSYPSAGITFGLSRQ